MRFFYNFFYILFDLLRKTFRIWSLAFFEFKLLYRDSRLGMLWAILSPLSQIGVYWFVFGIGLRVRSNMAGYPYLVWMLPGITAWYFCSKGVLTGAGELRSKLQLISKVNMPPYVLLASKIIAILLDHLILALIMFIILFANGWTPETHSWQMLYYTLSALIFMFALSMATSVLTLYANDFQRGLAAIMRLMFFMTPILWLPREDMPTWFVRVTDFNPFYYVINGYRSALLYRTDFWTDARGATVFWGTTLLLFALGCQWQTKIKNELSDFL